MAAKRKPGANISDAERHTVKRTLRLTPAESAALDAAAEARGVNVSRAVGALALEAGARRKAVAKAARAKLARLAAEFRNEWYAGKR